MSGDGAMPFADGFARIARSRRCFFAARRRARPRDLSRRPGRPLLSPDGQPVRRRGLSRLHEAGARGQRTPREFPAPRGRVDASTATPPPH